MDSHVRYDHFHYPRLVVLHCPSCAKQAQAANVDCPVGYEHFLDIASFRKLWQVSCLHCGFRREADWEQLKDYALWYRMVLREEYVWAWNAEHLVFIIQRLEKRADKKHPWAYFETYMRKEWLTKLSSERYVKKLKALLA